MLRLNRNSLLLVVLGGVVAGGLAPPSRAAEGRPEAPVRVGIAGLVHGHVNGFLRTAAAGQDVRIVGISEPDPQVAARYRDRYTLDPALFHSDLEAMLDAARPQAVAVYTHTLDHLPVVRSCAARG